MLGAIAGDIIGSIYEGTAAGQAGFSIFQEECRFTDDTVLTIATADVLLNGGDYTEAYQRWYQRHSNAGYGGMFHRWGRSESPAPYESFGNGSAMRVSPIGWWFDTLEETLAEAKRSAEVSHNHPHGIRGASAIAGAIFLARQGASAEELVTWVEDEIGYDIPQTPYDATHQYACDATCQESVPPALCAVLRTDTFEDAIRSAIWIGGDVDTIACMAGAVAEALYGSVPGAIRQELLHRLTEPMQEILAAFEAATGREERA